MAEFKLTGFADEIDQNLDIQMDELEKLGMKYIEMRGVDGKNVASLTLDEAKTVRKRLNARGFALSSVGSPVGKTMITEDFAPALAQFEHVLDLAEALESPYIRLFSFFIPEGESPAKYRDEVLRRLDVYIKKAAGRNVVLCHENERDIYGDNPDRCLDIMKNLGCDRFRFIFDPANFVLLTGEEVETYPRAYQMLKPYIEYMHIKDGIHGKWVVPAGYGEGKVREILADLKESGFSNFLSLEPHLANFKGFAELQPLSPVNGLEEGGPKQFRIAHDSLVKLLDEIGAAC